MFARIGSKVFEHYKYDLQAKVPTVLYALKHGPSPAAQKNQFLFQKLALGLGALVGNARAIV